MSQRVATLTPEPASSTSRPLEMPIAMLTSRSKRKTEGLDENATASRIPVKSPPKSKSVLEAAFNHGAPWFSNAPRKPSNKFAGKSSIPFPKSSAPAPPVVTAFHAAFGGATLQPLVNSSEEPPRLGKRLRPSTIGKAKSKDGQLEGEPGPSLWATLVRSEKGVIAQTLNRHLLQSQSCPYGATMATPRMLRDGLRDQEASFHAWVAARRAIEERQGGRWRLDNILTAAMELYRVALGVEMLEEVKGPHFTFVDPSYHNNAEAMVKQALRLSKFFAERGYGKNHIVISIPATEAGVHAAGTLENTHYVRTNLTFVSGLAHATICAEAGASFITFSYAALSEAFVQKNSSNPFARAMEALSPSSKRLADQAIESTAEYFRIQRIETRIILSITGLPTFREAQRLKGFDAIVLDTDQSQRVKLPLPPLPQARMRAPAEVSPAMALVRAQEPQYAAPHSATKDGSFLAMMPAEMRNVTTTTLKQGLNEPLAQMELALIHMFEFLQSEAQLAHLDDKALEEIYRSEFEEATRISMMLELGETPEQFIPIRASDVGFRMSFSLWDRPDAW